MNDNFVDVILYDNSTIVSEGSDMVEETFYPHHNPVSSKHRNDTTTKGSKGSRRAKIVQVRRSKKKRYGPSKFERLHDTKLLFKHVQLSRIKRRKYSALKNPKIESSMTSNDALPNDVLEYIMKMKLLNSDDVFSAGQTCVRWHGVCKRVWRKKKSKELSEAWAKSDHIPSAEELATVELLAAHGHPASQIIPRKVAALTETWEKEDYFPPAAEVTSLALLASNGHLPHQILVRKANMVKEIFVEDEDWDPPSLAEVACAAALATHGYITEVENLWLDELDLDSVSAGDLGNLVKCVHHNGNVSILVSFVATSVRCSITLSARI